MRKIKIVLYTTKIGNVSILVKAYKPFDAIQCKEELFLTKVESESVEVFSTNHFTHLRTVSFHGYVYNKLGR